LARHLLSAPQNNPMKNASSIWRNRMSCWVVPTIAADFLGIPLDQVMSDIHSGKLASKTESGFTFVDVAPDSPMYISPRNLTPPTYTVVSNEELVALEAAEEPGDWREARSDAEKLRRPPLAA
jgi:hypothetical protein